jgi:tricorn protease
MKTAHHSIPTAILVLVLAATAPAFATDPVHDARLLRFPDIHGDTVVFSHGGDLWSVPTGGGVATRLTTGDGLEVFPRFSPDGKWIAFTGQYDGSSDVYVMPATGGEPRRLTWYPAENASERMGYDNMVIGWTPDGKILFRSLRGPIGGFVGVPYVVSPEGGPEERFPLPESGIISFAPDGKRIAYTRIFRDFRTWKRYAGGMAQDVWIYDLEKKALDRVTDWEGTDTQPMWIGDSIYFLSDREDWKLNLWRYDLASRKTSRVTDFKEYDVKWPHSGSGKIVFENGGWLYLLDPAAGKPLRIPVDLPDDRKLARPHWVDVSNRITDFALAPGGKRAVFAARGDVFTLPAEHGNTRNVTATAGVREKSAVWSPDGKWIAYVSDATGEDEIYVVPQDGKGKPVQVTTGSDSLHYDPVWSPDSKKVAWSDRAMRLWYVDIAEKRPVQADKADVFEINEYAWSPDSKWIAYSKVQNNDLPAVFLYSIESRTITQATSGFCRSYGPQFDPDGKYLFALSDRDVNPVVGNFEASFTVTSPTRPYAIVLRSHLPSPFAPRSDEAKLEGEEKTEKPADKDGAKAGAAKDEKEKDKDKKEPFRIDLAGIQDRIVPFPVAPGEYRGLRAAKDRLFYLAAPVRALTGPPAGAKPRLVMYDLDKRKEQTILDPVDNYDLSPDGSRIVYRSEKTYGIVDAKEGAKVGDGKLDLSDLRMELDPEAEWRQIFAEAWRLERDFFYLPDMGKIDWPQMKRRYEPLLPYVSHRADLTYVIGEMIGELESGHAYTGGGDAPRPEKVPVGALGADLEPDPKAGLWRIARILDGRPWIESRRSPLAEPGIRVAAGDYLLAVNGKDLAASDDPYRLLVETPGHTVTLLVNSKPSRDGAREVTVGPLGDEQDLRYIDWVESNRKKVEQATGGRVGYVHIPNMGAEGLQEFIRQYFPQIRKEGLVVDARYNGGGFVSQMVLERLRRVVMGMGGPRGGRPGTFPDAAFNGPMVCLLNMYSASDGDIFPYYFREYGLGPLIGTRSWGGVIGIRGLGPNLVDGGYVTMPEFSSYNLKSQWIMENHGVDPDIVVDNLPQDEMAGKDAQLERAIQEVMKRVEERKPTWPPPPPSRDLRDPDATEGVERR